MYCTRIHLNNWIGWLSIRSKFMYCTRIHLNNWIGWVLLILVKTHVLYMDGLNFY